MKEDSTCSKGGNHEPTKFYKCTYKDCKFSYDDKNGLKKHLKEDPHSGKIMYASKVRDDIEFALGQIK